jgi:hypothetical protein
MGIAFMLLPGSQEARHWRRSGKLRKLERKNHDDAKCEKSVLTETKTQRERSRTKWGEEELGETNIKG